MAPAPASDLGTLADGLRLLFRRPAAALAMLCVGTLLGSVGPLLQRWTGRADDPAYLILGIVGMLPWELYFLPRFLAGVDAEELGHPANPFAEWRDRFEERWFRTLAAKVALNLAIGFGLLALVVPGLLVLFCFGWAPYRVLLRGESLATAMRGSLAMMRQGWRRAMLMVCSAFLVAFSATLGLLAAASALHPSGGPIPLGSPLRWVLEAVSVVINLWLSATLLAAYQRMERYSEPSPSK
jgi:hypothetical protein